MDDQGALLQVTKIGDERGAALGLAVSGLAFLGEQVALGEHAQAQSGQLESGTQTRDADEQTSPSPRVGSRPRGPVDRASREVVLSEDLPQSLGAPGGAHHADRADSPVRAFLQIPNQVGDTPLIAARRARENIPQAFGPGRLLPCELLQVEPSLLEPLADRGRITEQP